MDKIVEKSKIPVEEGELINDGSCKSDSNTTPY
jgi:hypothetical protein